MKQGYLTKQGGSVKSIKRRWFTLQKGGTETPRLRYYEDVNVKGMAPLSVVSLLGARAWKTRADRIDLDVSGRTYFLQAPSDSDCEEWFRAFEETIPVLEQSQFEKDHPIKVEMEGFLHKSGGTIKVLLPRVKHYISSIPNSHVLDVEEALVRSARVQACVLQG